MKIGDTRRAPCSWCGAEIVQTWASSPDSPAGFWDVSACKCGSLAGLAKYGKRVIDDARRADGRTRRYRNGKPWTGGRRSHWSVRV